MSQPANPVLIRGVRRYGAGDPVDVLVDDGQIAAIGAELSAPDGAEVIEAAGQVLLPGFVDLHTHLREPGREDTETIATAIRRCFPPRGVNAGIKRGHSPV